MLATFLKINMQLMPLFLNDKVYVIAGATAGVYSNKVFAADLNASVAGVYDLYRKDGNASAGTPIVQAEVADGSVTASKIASNTITTSDLANRFSNTSSLRLLLNHRLRQFMQIPMLLFRYRRRQIPDLPMEKGWSN